MRSSAIVLYTGSSLVLGLVITSAHGPNLVTISQIITGHIVGLDMT